MPEVVKPNANEILRDILKDRGIKQVFVARKMGLSEPSFTALITGRKKFTADIAIQIGDILNVPYQIFLSKSYS